MSSRSSDKIAATLSFRFGCDASQLSTSAQGRCLAGARGGGHSVATILRRDVMATVSPSLMALSTDGKARRISRTEAVFIVNNYVSHKTSVKGERLSHDGLPCLGTGWETPHQPAENANCALDGGVPRIPAVDAYVIPEVSDR